MHRLYYQTNIFKKELFPMQTGITVIATVFGVLCAIAATVLAFIFILPEKRANSSNKFVAALHDLLNFKHLLIEKILKALYIFSTAFTLIYGFFSIFSFQRIPHYSYDYYGYTSEVYYETEWTGYIGLLTMILGPIIIRIMYEFIMMFVTLVQNSSDINRKMKVETVEDAPAKADAAVVADEELDAIAEKDTAGTAV